MKAKQSSPLKDEPGINDFILTIKPKEEYTLNIEQDPPDVKNGLESLFTIIGQFLHVGLPLISQLEKEANAKRLD